jgi:Ca2+-binding EF-hand superfamily protein
MRDFPKALCLAVVCGLASAVPAQETVPAQEAEQTPEQLFDSLDANDDSELTAEEIPDAQQRHFRRLLRTGDENQDGKLTRAEFNAGLTSEDRPVANPESERGDQRRPQFDAAGMFARWDADNSGTVSLAELPEQMRDRMRRIFEDLGKDAITLEVLQRATRGMGQFDPEQFVNMLRRMDRNEDGKVSLSEIPEEQRERFQGMFDRFGTDEIDLSQAGQRFAQLQRRPEDGAPPHGDRPRPPVLQLLDANGDQSLSREELAAAADKFDELDQNGDGRIDPAELMGRPPEPVSREMQRDTERSRNARGERRRPDAQTPETDRPRRPDADETP